MKTRNEVKIPIMNPNLRAICEKYGYNLPHVVDVILNRYIKEILKELSERVPTFGKMVKTKLTQKQKNQVKEDKLVVEYNDKGEVIMPRYKCVTTHTARRSGITQYVSLEEIHHRPDDARKRPQTPKTFMDYIKLSSDEIADEIDAIANGSKSDVF